MQVPFASLTDLNPYGLDGIPAYYAIGGSQYVSTPPSGSELRSYLYVAPLVTDTLNIRYASGVPALTSGNTKNWLLTMAPDAYFNGVMAEAKLFEEDFEQAAIWESRMRQTLNDVNNESVVAQYRGASVILPGPTP